ncbi:MAG TPA: lysine--tRNA ligase [Acidimicrobiia bacterium]|nr:lysine--tRNA ligase [Acidimicrobiia bacterium]
MKDHVEQETDPRVTARRERHALIIESGGYPDRFDRTDLAADLRERFADLEAGTQTGTRVAVAGRLMLHRSFGKLQFGTLRDRSGSIQLLVDRGVDGDELADRFEMVDLGDWVGAGGVVMTTRKGELTVRIDDLVILQKSLRPLPDKWHGLQDLEQRSRHRYLDLMVNEEARQVAMTRTLIVSELRRQFEERGFVEVETPVLLAQATGATARPFSTEHRALGMTMYLRIATELYLKRLVVGGMERVFEIGRIFRNEGIDSTHNPEFTMLEAYQALSDYGDILKMVEEIFGAVTERATGQTMITYRGQGLDLTPPYRQVRMTELISETLGVDVGLDTPIETLRSLASDVGVEVGEGWSPGLLVAEIYEEAVEDRIWQPTFVTHPPIEVSPLARRNRDDPRLADRFELVIAGSEYANAFSELNDPEDQRARFEVQAAARAAGEEDAHPLDEDYLLALEYGLPPTGGLGIGVDRLVMLLTDQAHIRDVILFPTLRPEA